MPLSDLVRAKRAEILEIAQRNGAREVRVFGSVARGDESRESDIDFVVKFDSGRSLFDHIALIQDLEDTLGKRVDVVDERGIHWFVREQVLRDSVPI